MGSQSSLLQGVKVTKTLLDIQASTLFRFRKESGKTLRQVSSDATVALGYLSEIERGKKAPTPEIIESLLMSYGISLDQWYREQYLTYNGKVYTPKESETNE